MAVIRNFQNVSHVSKEGNAPVYVTFYLGKDKVVIPCNLSVPVKSWTRNKARFSQMKKITKTTIYVLRRYDHASTTSW